MLRAKRDRARRGRRRRAARARGRNASRPARLMHLLVTRPEADARRAQEPLEAMGSSGQPRAALAADFDDPEPIRLDGVQALVATSRNALRALAQSPALEAALRLPLFAVGPATAAEAARRPALRASSRDRPRRADLVAVIAANAMPSDGPLLHVSGDTLAFDLERRSRSGASSCAGRSSTACAGERAPDRRSPTQFARERWTGSSSCRRERRQHSPVWSRRPALPSRRAGSRTFACLDAVAEALDPLGPAHVNVAGQPNLEEMLALLARLAPESR